ncbi:Histidine kinase-, DNA gyrase B-, and HSP90-like ATPase [Paenibacillus sp. ov031]|uniref:sensor histidine kinase n=1 Tax=unclassified Paenibacillus TaxID=185978 RepID=UPI00091BFED5|nr:MULTISPECIES: HAMP domain-containing sensor histidine kinase [unclassified Paenibacillus]SHN60577.1 Histidine kinase-, DNA gyrase B-, and HSP90-like ATPase [Paenibacillus sp. ov031]SLJ88702.1 Histidine kinase-, DNA gyrase B-, and HSP90-like ATPase [Paenibacillus sp. RU5A]SOC62201.1 Histidine kinase-, DNA gyrase B-, and HSP90-like ATPase [Paenibacillus sp. RU26A]SOC68470.1 Histidine kinase-, DNA gyrase B-, and HSP90-like ATPase [Paenibacillus sp. RU5M]
MDTKSRKSKEDRKIGIDLLVIIIAVIIGIFILINEYSYLGLSLRFSTSRFIWELLSSIILGLLVARLFRYFKAPHNKRSFWDGSVLIDYFHIWRTGFRASLQNGRLTFGLILMFLLTALAGICFWEAVTYYGQGWLILYLLLFVLFLVPYMLSKLGRFMAIINGSKEIAKGNIQNSIQDNGNDSLSELAGYINNMKAGYQSALEHQMKSERLKTELITNVSHDLKTPLTSIINYVDLLKKENHPSETTRAYIETLERKALRLKLLIEDLFDISKMASGTIELDMEYVDVATLLTQAIAESNTHMGQASLEIRERIAKFPIHANLDGNKIWRVFENLISNAQKYSLPGTRIYIYLDETDDLVRFKIQNTSAYEIDFDAEELFERFKRADESRQTEGSGLGLAIVKSIVELHGGKIKVEIHGDQFNVIVHLPKKG